ncbi:NAD(P)H-dependent oxidoreductase [Candidatus Woesearchaeota archaeon]|nr:NAD(P)H-dependent oxidoreductase [Candidatus Woesearchaeota archaeon]USN44503.1 MAG: NAD(P)H-dependent oxidoreductase [Candidatus Woesearchaeota archaeon]
MTDIKKHLIIVAHPSTKGFSHAVAKVYKEAAEKKGGEVELINLYDEEWHLDFLTFENIKEDFPKPLVAEKIREKILWAERVIFCFPLWWFDCPAILKNMFDLVFIPGFAYRYDRVFPKSIAKGKLGPRQASLFVTCDSSKWVYRLLLNPMKTNWIVGRIWFCGFKLRNFTLFDRMLFRTEKEKESFLRVAEQVAKH